jgi:2,4-dienoyl-CoA reductase (NADPH2)
VNPRVGREAETEIDTASQPKRILVVGGGPAGLESAFIAAIRGHAVSLWEKEDVLGGQLRLVGMVPGRGEFADYILFLEQQAVAAGVDVVQSKMATVESIMEYAPDTVILATGAVPHIPSFVSSDSDKVITAWDVLKGDSPTHHDVVILGGGAAGLETAHYLVEKNNEVTIVEATGMLGQDMGAIASFYLRNMLKKAGVKILRFAHVKRVTENNVLISMEDKEVLLENMDTIVLALGAKSNNSLAHEITGMIPEVHVIGDASSPRKALNAVAEGFDTGRTI